MDTSLPTLTPQDQPPDANPAEAAFAELSAKVDFLETLLRGLVAKRKAMPDYSETLGEIATLLEKMRTAIKTLAARPAMTLTPDAMAEQIAAAAVRARAEDAATINKARDRIDKTAARMEHLAGTVATVREQRSHLLWVAIGGLLAGMLLWSFFPGTIARAMPDSWTGPNGWRRGRLTLTAGRPASACLPPPSRNAGEPWFSPMRSCRRTGTPLANAAKQPRRRRSRCAAPLR